MEISIVNGDKNPIEIDVDEWTLKEYQDAHRAAEFSMKCSRSVPIKKYAHIVASEGHRVLFRGYAQKPKIVNTHTREITCKGEEDLLLRRYTGRYAYQANTHYLGHVFQSDPPSQIADGYGITGSLGMLFMANSLMPINGNVITTGTPEYDWVYAGIPWCYKIAGCGLDSRVGSADIYAEGTLLPRVNTNEELESTDICCYSDADDLYIRLNDSDLNTGFGPKMCILAENVYDTGIRMGTIDLASTLMTGNFQTNYDRVLDVLIDAAEFYGLNPRYRRTRDCTYLDALDEPTETEYMLTEENIEDISQEYSDDREAHAIIGMGYGSRDVQHVYTPSNHAWKGVWIMDKEDVDDGFLDAVGNLRPYLNAEYARRQADEIFTITPTPQWGPQPKPNDMIRLRLDGEAERLLQVASAKIDHKGKYEMEIGGRMPDIIDAFNAKDSMERVYLEEYLVEYGKSLTADGTDLQMGDTTHGSCTGGSVSVTIPTDVYESDWSHRVTLDLSISTDQSPVSCVVLIQVNGGYNFLCQPRHYLLGDTIEGLDITTYCNYGSASTINVWVIKNGEWSGAACANHPTMDISATVKCYKRTILGSNIKRGLNKQKITYATWKKVKGNVYKWVRS